MNPINPAPTAAGLPDRTARAAAGDTPVDVGAVLVRGRSNRRRWAGRGGAGTAPALAAGLVAAGGSRGGPPWRRWPASARRV